MNSLASPLAGKTAIITGAGSGIGRATALSLAARGVNVIVAVRRGPTGEETVRLVEAEGGVARSIEADCTDYGAVEAAVALATDSFGGLDIMIHNAVYAHGSGVTPIEELADDHVERMFNVSLAGSYNTARAALPWLKKSACPRYIGFTSPFGLYAARTDASYSTVKSGVRGFVKALAREWGPYGITVNVISPAALSEGADQYFEDNPGMREAFYRKFSLRRIGRPREDVAEAIAAICGPEFGYLTGQTVVLDGGIYSAL
jgi:NAD(P)-dependent dehydrogenase (short-subunit alcohol dehydrogenase family)